MEIATHSTHVYGPAAESPSLTLADLAFELPSELVAQTPAAERDQARLLVLQRASGRTIHSQVAALPDFLHAGDLLVLNDTRVLRARVYGTTSTGARVELLLVHPLSRSDSSCNDWLCLGKPARRLHPGTQIKLHGEVYAAVVAAPGNGHYTIRFGAGTDVFALLEQYGEMPLPPYIRRPDGPLAEDLDRYQTVFASQPGAVAAPTAGLHFTDKLLASLHQHGVQTCYVTLHVGPGTFLPVRDDDYRTHVMDPEWCNIPAATVEAVRHAKWRGGRVIAVGTTTTRALESAATGGEDVLQGGARWADRFIVPGYRFHVIDALFTNFHLPGSTLLLLVAALIGRDLLVDTYNEAVRRGYRFYSYGDAMLIQ
jgi:S-adenosylmethionine:tRNA ribosyltransferase-isomerase